MITTQTGSKVAKIDRFAQKERRRHDQAEFVNARDEGRRRELRERAERGGRHDSLILIIVDGAMSV